MLTIALPSGLLELPLDTEAKPFSSWFAQSLSLPLLLDLVSTAGVLSSSSSPATARTIFATAPSSAENHSTCSVSLSAT